MKTIVTDDIFSECKNLLLMFTDTEYVRRHIIMSYPNLSDAKRKSVPSRIKSHVVQGMQFLDETDENIYTAPLTLFYAINNFAKAIFLVYNPTKSIAGSHGIELGKQIKDNLNDINSIGKVSIVAGKKGTFRNLLDAVGDSIEPETEVCLKDIFSIVPELSEIYSLRYHEEPNAFLLQRMESYEYEINLHFPIDGKIDYSDKFSLLAENGCIISITGSEAIHIYLSAAHMPENHSKCFASDVFGNEYACGGITVNGKRSMLSKITSLYICFYAFSMLVRYYPEKWIDFCNTADATIIRKLIVYCRREMLVEVLQLLNMETYHFSTKMEVLRKEIKQDELWDLVKKAIRDEKFRSGRSPLTELL